MGTGVLQFLTAPPNRCSHEFSNRRNSPGNITSTSASWCCFSTKYGGRTGGSQWERTAWSDKERSRYQDEFFAHEYDDEEEFGFRNAAKQRTWWSDDSLSWDEDDDEEEIVGGFGILGGSIGFSWLFKVLNALGWMVPAVLVSMLLGTGTNGFVMALALPLAQSALSFVFDTLWRRPTDRTRPKSRKSKSAYAGAAVNRKTRKEKEQTSQSDRKNADYQSWVAANNVSAKKGKARTQSFGGWDELDKQSKEEVSKPSMADEERRQTEGKLSRRARNRQTPLLVRLLIAFFPFLGFWTKLL